MKGVLLIFACILLLQNVTSMGNGNKNKGNQAANRGGQGNQGNQGNKGNKGLKVTLFPCGNRLLREERIVGGPPGKSKNWNGFINVKNANRKPPLTVTLIFDFPTKITVDQYDGEIDPKSKGAYWRIHVRPETHILHFTVRGRPHEPLPSVTSMRFKGNEKCMAPVKWDENAPVQEMHLPPPPSPDWIPDPELPEEPIVQPVIVTTTPRPKPVSECGVRQISKQAYVTNGYASVPGDWPWHAAMYHKQSRSLSYKCGGTLISNKHVLTAAHCLYSSGSPIIPERVIIQLGKYNLEFNDVNTMEYQVFAIKIHEKYSNFDFNDDIALLKLAQEVAFTKYIQPACLWQPEKADLATVVNRPGYVCGWGLAEDDELSDTLTEATMPVVDFFSCLESNRDFFGPVLSQFNYCAGYKNGTSVCNGDSGGGMFFSEGRVWHIRGIVSFSAIREDRNVCNPLEYVIFTDVAKYLPWIQENM